MARLISTSRLASRSTFRLQRWPVATSSYFVHEIRHLNLRTNCCKLNYSTVDEDNIFDEDRIQCTILKSKMQRLKHIRNVGILAHVDAGKTTVTERMLELAGVVRNAGCVDDGNTVTDYLPAERERGITIQSAAISFQWGWHNQNQETKHNDNVSIQIIDTPGHVDFSVEVNRSVAVLDGAVLVVDAVAGVQAQTETVWRAMTRPSMNNHIVQDNASSDRSQWSENDQLNHEPLPCLVLVNKMDKDGCHFVKAIQSLQEKLPGANPIPIQIPLFISGSSSSAIHDVNSFGANDRLPSGIETVSINEQSMNSTTGAFIGIIDLIHMRAIVWTDRGVGVENCAPIVVHLMQPNGLDPINRDCKITKEAVTARSRIVESLAEVDERTEEQYLDDEIPSNYDLRAALRRATIAQKAVPVLAAAALKGKGLEPLLDSIADFLPSPLDRNPPALHQLDKNRQQKTSENRGSHVNLGHPLHNSSLALAFKVVHMKGRGSGDGRIVFARVYSGKLRDREQLQIITPPAPGELAAKIRVERIGGMLELAGGRFDNIEDGTVESGEVCALVGLKTVVTGDTLILASDISSDQKQKKGNKGGGSELFYLAGVASPKPVITVRLEAETSQQETRLSEALKLMATEDPSLLVEETESATLLSGLGELHIEVTLDRLHREYGLQVMVGPPSVAYRETVRTEIETPGGLIEYDKKIGATRLQASVHLCIKPNHHSPTDLGNNTCIILSDPVVTVGRSARDFLGLDQDLQEEELIEKNSVARALIQGCKGALRRGVLKSSQIANVTCHIEDVDAEGGLSALMVLPGALQAAAANAVSVCLKENANECSLLEPRASIEVIIPNDMVGTVLSDLNNRRGIVGEVIVGETIHSKSLVRGDVPMVEILGYANSLRSLTGGEGTFTSEYRGHSFC